MRSPLLVFLVLLAAFSCSNSSGPDKESPRTTIDIGPAGGELKVDAITVSVPPGSFSAPVAVALTVTDEKPYGGDAVSNTYKLSGIPADYSKPITISVVYSGTLTNETLLAVGEDTIDFFSGETVRFERFYPARIDSGRVVCTIPPRTTAPEKKNPKNGGTMYADLYITALTNYFSNRTSPHFRILSSHDHADYTKQLGAYMEGMYKVVENMGFSYHLPDNVYGHLDSVYVLFFKDIPDPPAFQIFCTDGIVMLFDKKYAYGSLTYAIKHDLARTFMLVMAGYYTKSEWKAFEWFDLAMSDWLARFINSTTPDEVPLPMEQEPLSAFQGIPIFNKERSAQFYYEARCFTPLIEFLNKKFKIATTGDAVSRIYDERYKGKNLSQSLESVLGVKETVWWPEFVKEYISGNIYNVPASSFTSSAAIKGQFTVTERDSIKTFNGVFGDLTANIYRISIDPSFAGEIGSIWFTAESRDISDEYLSVLLFGMKGGKPVYLGRGKEIAVTDPSQATDSNTLFAVVTNSLIDYPFHTDNDYSIAVNVKRKTGFNIQDLKNARIVLANFYQEYNVVHADGKTERGGGGGGPRIWNDIPMTLAGNVLTGRKVVEWTGLWGNSSETLDFKITISVDLQTASLEVKRVSEDHDNHLKETETFSFPYLPLLNPAEYSCRAVWGTPSADYMAGLHMKDVTYTYRWESTDGSTSDVRENAMFYCTGAVIEFF